MDFFEFLADAVIFPSRIVLLLGLLMGASFIYLDGALLYYLIVEYFALSLWLMKAILGIAAIYNVFVIVMFWVVFNKVNNLVAGKHYSDASKTFFVKFKKLHDLFSIFSVLKMLIIIGIFVIRKAILGGFLGVFGLIIAAVYLFNSNSFLHSPDFSVSDSRK